MIEQHDERRLYCRMLGHDVPFRYCRAPGQDLPCRRICDCWWEAFDVCSFLEEHLGAAALAAIRQTAPPKATTLMELIRNAQKSAAEQ